MSNLQIGAISKHYCNTCKNKTKHSLLNKIERREWEIEDEGGPNEQPIWCEEWEYRFWVCLGCDTALMEEAYCGPGYRDHNGDEFYDCITHPQRAFFQWKPKRFKSISVELSNAYKECINSFNAGLNLSCAICLRALLEGICVSKGIDDKVSRSLEGKLKKLSDEKHLPQNIVDGLHSFKFMGDHAAHRLKAPEKHELNLAIQITEDLLNYLYELNYRLESAASRLAKSHKDEFDKLKSRKTKQN